MDFMKYIDASRLKEICLNYEMITYRLFTLHTLNYDKPYVSANNGEEKNDHQNHEE